MTCIELTFKIDILLQYLYSPYIDTSSLYMVYKELEKKIISKSLYIACIGIKKAIYDMYRIHFKTFKSLYMSCIDNNF